MTLKFRSQPPVGPDANIAPCIATFQRDCPEHLLLTQALGGGSRPGGIICSGIWTGGPPGAPSGICGRAACGSGHPSAEWSLTVAPPWSSSSGIGRHGVRSWCSSGSGSAGVSGSLAQTHRAAHSGQTRQQRRSHTNTAAAGDRHSGGERESRYADRQQARQQRRSHTTHGSSKRQARHRSSRQSDTSTGPGETKVTGQREWQQDVSSVTLSSVSARCRLCGSAARGGIDPSRTGV